MSARDAHDQLARRLGTGDAVVIGLGSMIGARSSPPSRPRRGGRDLVAGRARAGGAGRLLQRHLVGPAGGRYPESGGTYVYGQRRLGEGWGYLASWSLRRRQDGELRGDGADGRRLRLAGAGTCGGGCDSPGAYRAQPAWGAQRALATRVIVAVVLVVLALVVAALWSGGEVELDQLRPDGDADVHGVLRSAAFLFFAFAGYARIATLGEEVRDPARTIPRAIPIALAITLLVYAAIATGLLVSISPSAVAGSDDPLATAVAAEGWSGLESVVRVGAAVAALGSLLALILGVSRTTFAMARDGHLPRTLAAVHLALPGAAPCRAGRRARRHGRRPGSRPAWRDRLLVVRRARLRDRQRQRPDVAPGRRQPRCWSWGSPDARRSPSRCPSTQCSSGRRARGGRRRLAATPPLAS